MLSAINKNERFTDLCQAVQHCTLCHRLCKRVKVLSKLNGNIDSKVLFVAEAPGRLGADKTGIPLFGDKTGDNFERLLKNIGWQRQEVFITNALLCNPRDESGNNATPSTQEIFNCLPYLQMVIHLVQPEVIVSLGNTALTALSLIRSHGLNLKDHVAQLFDWNTIKLFPLYHPAPRAMVHRSLANQTSDFIILSKCVHPQKGLIRKKHKYTTGNVLSASQFEQLVLAILKKVGRISYFKLTKLLYLIDLNALDQFGATVTGQVYLRQEQGPWPPSLKADIPRMKGYEITIRGSKTQMCIEPGPSPRFEPHIDSRYLNVIEKVLTTYADYDNEKIKTIVYRTAPMKYILQQEKLGRDVRKLPVLYHDKTAIDLDRETEYPLFK